MLESVLFRKSFTKGYGNLLVFLDYKLHRASQGGDKNLFDMRKAGLTSLVNELHVKKGGLWGYLNKKDATHSQKLAQARKVMDPEEEQNIVGSVNAWNQSEERLYYVNKIKDVYDRCVNGKAIVKPSEFNTCVNFVHSAVLLGNGSRGGVIPSITNLEWGRRRVPDIDPDDEEDDGDSTRILDSNLTTKKTSMGRQLNSLLNLNDVKKLITCRNSTSLGSKCNSSKLTLTSKMFTLKRRA